MSATGPVMRLKEYWYIAATARELGSKPLARTVLGQPLVLFRQEDGSPAALVDRCAHRSVALSTGRVAGGCVECPYHGWRYRADGACVDIPSLRANQAPPPDVEVRAYPAVESQGFIWVYMGNRTPAAKPYRFAHLGEPGWSHFLMVTRFEAGALACLENFLDCPHTVYVHQGWFRSRNAKEVRASVRRGQDMVEVEFHEERDAESVVSRTLFPSQGKMVHTDAFLMPTTSRVDYRFGPDRHFIITSQCTPVSDGETLVYTVMNFRFGKVGPLVRLFFAPLSRKIIRQDRDILRSQSANLRRFGGSDFTFVETDLVAPHIWVLWQHALAEGDGSRNGAAGQPLEEFRQEVVLRF